MNLSRFFWLLFILVIGWQFILSAQEVTGKMEGRIVDENRSAVPGVVISITSPSLRGAHTTQSNKDGYFRFILLPQCFYTLKASHISYRPVTVDSTQIRLGTATSLFDLSFVEKPYELEEIIVNDRRNLIDPNSTYSQLISYQLPMSFRLGLEVNF